LIIVGALLAVDLVEPTWAAAGANSAIVAVDWQGDTATPSSRGRSNSRRRPERGGGQSCRSRQRFPMPAKFRRDVEKAGARNALKGELRRWAEARRD
jgi:hypothetical protein